jgi:hypothetical protein
MIREFTNLPQALAWKDERLDANINSPKAYGLEKETRRVIAASNEQRDQFIKEGYRLRAQFKSMEDAIEWINDGNTKKPSSSPKSSHQQRQQPPKSTPTKHAHHQRHHQQNPNDNFYPPSPIWNEAYYSKSPQTDEEISQHPSYESSNEQIEYKDVMKERFVRDDYGMDYFESKGDETFRDKRID